MKSCKIYVQGDNILKQEEVCRNYARNNNLSVSKVITGITISNFKEVLLSMESEDILLIESFPRMELDLSDILKSMNTINFYTNLIKNKRLNVIDVPNNMNLKESPKAAWIDPKKSGIFL